MARRAIGVFAATLFVAILTGAVAWSLVPDAFRRRWMPESFERIDRSDDEYLALYRTEAVDHYVHLHRTDPVVERSMREARVLFVGTSRMMLGFDAGLLSGFFRKHDTRHYLLGFAYGETVGFTEAVFERAGLEPEWVVANVDGFFFPKPSHYGWEVLHSSVQNAYQVEFETEATFRAIGALHRWVPYASVDRTKSVWLRSKTTGHWRAYFVPGKAVVFERPRRGVRELNAHVLRTARKFRDECQRRGARLVLTLVPSPLGDREQAVELAEELGVPLVAPDMEGLGSYDGSHLTAESAARFTRAFLDEFEPMLRTATPRR